MDREILILGNAHKLVRGNGTELRVFPPGQRLSAHDRQALQVHYWLEDDLDLPGIQRLPKRLSETVAPDCTLMHRSTEFDKVTLFEALGFVHCGIGVAQKIRGRISYPARAESHARANLKRLSFNLNRVRENSQRLQGDQLALGRGGNLPENGELIASKPRSHPPIGDVAFQPPRNFSKDPVSEGMAKGVIDPFEVVEVNKQQDPLGRAAFEEECVQALHEPPPVGKSGQRVFVRFPVEAGVRGDRP